MFFDFNLGVGGALLPLGVTPLTASSRVDLRVVPGKHELPEMPAVRERRARHSGRAEVPKRDEREGRR